MEAEEGKQERKRASRSHCAARESVFQEGGHGRMVSVMLTGQVRRGPTCGHSV